MSRRPNIAAREHILSTAYSLILRNGFNGISMDDVAHATGLKKANLFHYYKTKDALGLAVFDYVIANSHKNVEDTLEYGKSDPIAAVDRMFDQASGAMEENGCSGGCYVGNIGQELSDCNETVRRKVSEHLEKWSAQWAEFLKAKRDSGYFRPEMDPKFSALGLLALFQGAMMFCKANRTTAALSGAKHLARQHFESFRS